MGGYHSDMLPQRLKSSYREYEEDTDTVATWLALKAKECGYPAKSLDQNNGVPKTVKEAPSSGLGGRLKGKERMEANEAASQQAKASSSYQASRDGSTRPRPTYTISIQDFINLARHIRAVTKPTFRIPQHAMSALDRAIWLHQERHSAAVRGEDESTESNGTRLHFLGVPETTREIQRSRMLTNNNLGLISKTSQVAKPESAQAPTARLTNRFQGLVL